MKRVIGVIVLLALLLAGCGSSSEIKSNGKLKIISTVFPGYDFAKQICGDKAEVTLLLPPGAESHTYEPSAKDMIAVRDCDLFIYIGGESDIWADKMLSAVDGEVNTFRMMDCVTLVEEELKEGMEAEHEDEKEYDEHVWTSLRNSVKILDKLAEKVCALDGINKDIYNANKEAYSEKISELDKNFTNFFQTLEKKVLIFGDRFPIRYFTEDYGLDYYAAFPGCNADSMPSASTIAFLVDKVKAEKIKAVFYIEFSNQSIADTIAEQTGTKTAMFHTCHNVTARQLENGVTYVSLMEENFRTLKENIG